MKKIECDGKCGKKDRRRNLKRIKDSWYCISCQSERRKNHREYLKRDVLHIRKKADIMKEVAERRKRLLEEYNKRKETEPQMPKIKGSKSRSVSNQLHFYITKDERQFLWKKYILMGLSPILANEEIKRDVKFLTEFVEKLRNQKKTDEQISSHFKEEFAKLIIKD